MHNSLFTRQFRIRVQNDFERDMDRWCVVIFSLMHLDILSLFGTLQGQSKLWTKSFIVHHESRTHDYYWLCQMRFKNLIQMTENSIEFMNYKDVFSRRKHSIDCIGEYMKYDSYILIWYRFLNGRNLVISLCSNFEFNVAPSHVTMLQVTTAGLPWPVQHLCVIQ